MLDHRYYGNTLAPLKTSSAVDYLKEMFREAILPELTKYMGQVAPNLEYLFKEAYKGVNPCAWCKSGKKLGFDDALTEVALSLVDAVSSSAGLERSFSVLSFAYANSVAAWEWRMLVKRPSCGKYCINLDLFDINKERGN